MLAVPHQHVLQHPRLHAARMVLDFRVLLTGRHVQQSQRRAQQQQPCRLHHRIQLRRAAGLQREVALVQAKAEQHLNLLRRHRPLSPRLGVLVPPQAVAGKVHQILHLQCSSVLECRRRTEIQQAAQLLAAGGLLQTLGHGRALLRLLRPLRSRRGVHALLGRHLLQSRLQLWRKLLLQIAAGAELFAQAASCRLHGRQRLGRRHPRACIPPLFNGLPPVVHLRQHLLQEVCVPLRQLGVAMRKQLLLQLGQPPRHLHAQLRKQVDGGGQPQPRLSLAVVLNKPPLHDPVQMHVIAQHQPLVPHPALRLRQVGLLHQPQMHGGLQRKPHWQPTPRLLRNPQHLIAHMLGQRQPRRQPALVHRHILGPQSQSGQQVLHHKRRADQATLCVALLHVCRLKLMLPQMPQQLGQRLEAHFCQRHRHPAGRHRHRCRRRVHGLGIGQPAKEGRQVQQPPVVLPLGAQHCVVVGQVHGKPLLLVHRLFQHLAQQLSHLPCLCGARHQLLDLAPVVQTPAHGGHMHRVFRVVALGLVDHKIAKVACHGKLHVIRAFPAGGQFLWQKHMAHQHVFQLLLLSCSVRRSVRRDRGHACCFSAVRKNCAPRSKCNVALASASTQAVLLQLQWPAPEKRKEKQKKRKERKVATHQIVFHFAIVLFCFELAWLEDMRVTVRVGLG
eukprot:m.285067 g.285067  ORF g.285067 m.285067 type:complete len:672 (+) comp22915_c0_seq18:2368-4383(+)